MYPSTTRYLSPSSRANPIEKNTREVSKRGRRATFSIFVTTLLLTSASLGEALDPKEVLGYAIGEDFKLASYDEAIRYFQRLSESSNYVEFVNAGTSTLGTDMYYAVISAPQNLRRFEEYKSLHRELLDPRVTTDSRARQIAHDSKIIVHIDGGMHSAEAADHQLPIELAYTLIRDKGKPDIREILENVILVLWPTLNPDGQNMIAEWYSDNVGTEYEEAPLPWLNQKYVGNDNNRDGYMLNVAESRVVTAAQIDYSPAIFYTQHQKAPFPSRIWVPPFADPVSDNISPLMRVWTNLIGTRILTDFEQKQLSGASSESRFDNWYPGYLDYVHVFRHSISFFTETALHLYASPKFYSASDFPEREQDLKPRIRYPTPWRGGWWRISDAIEYMKVASLSVLEIATGHREQLLLNRFYSAKHTIEKFESDELYAYAVPVRQSNVVTASEFVQRLVWNGVEVHRVLESIAIGGKTLEPGSWIIKMDQPFAGLVNELVEVQHYPQAVIAGLGRQFSYPYDATGWTLPLLMDIEVSPIRQSLDDVLEKLILDKNPEPPGGEISGTGKTYILDINQNASYRAINEILTITNRVSIENLGSNEAPEYTFVITGIGRNEIERIALANNVKMAASREVHIGEGIIEPSRIGLYRPWRPSIDEGWTSWVLEQFDFVHTRLTNQRIRIGNLSNDFDAIIFPDIDSDWIMDGYKTGRVPNRYDGGVGDDGLSAVIAFVDSGGTVVAMNRSAIALIDLLALPVKNCLDGVDRENFFGSGALLEVQLPDRSTDLLHGLSSNPVVMFTNGPAFAPDTEFEGEILAVYDAHRSPLRSGMLVNPAAIQGTAAAMEVRYGNGKILLFGFRPQWRGQAHGTYKFLFNALFKRPHGFASSQQLNPSIGSTVTCPSYATATEQNPGSGSIAPD